MDVNQPIQEDTASTEDSKDVSKDDGHADQQCDTAEGADQPLESAGEKAEEEHTSCNDSADNLNSTAELNAANEMASDDGQGEEEVDTEGDILQLQFESLEGDLSNCDFCVWSPDGRQFAAVSTTGMPKGSEGPRQRQSHRPHGALGHSSFNLSSSVRMRTQKHQSAGNDSKRGILRIIDSSTLVVLATFVTTKRIKRLSWSPNSDSIAVLDSSELLVEVFSVYTLERICGISDDETRIVRYTRRSQYHSCCLLQISYDNPRIRSVCKCLEPRERSQYPTAFAWADGKS
eukprot:gb/GECG01002365.1/.p1 GENE.gb/GECG01002365.1/~~gb/GECG01002365.1/.p1  ORF type:complete len:289 (+),score=45.83 gb/GECG01002365.1/:1-867(+)